MEPEIIRDLIAGQLPWHQTRQIMSAYKDEGRFLQYLAVLQQRMRLERPHSPADRPASVHRPDAAIGG